MIIDMNAIMTNPEAKRELEDFQGRLEALPEIHAMMEAAKSIEDAYEIVKKFVKVKYEFFKEMCMDAWNYFAEDKMALADEALDEVVGGANWFTRCWEKCKSTIITVAVLGTCVVAGAVAGAVVGCGVGALPGMFLGAVAGVATGAAVGMGILAAVHYGTDVDIEFFK